MPIQPGQTLSHYRLLDRVGEGGMGVVFRAHDEHLDRDVAVKVLRPGRLGDQAARERFRTEALALSRLSHPNVETAHDFDTAEGQDFLVMEFVPGATVGERLAGGPLPEKEVLRLGGELADGLAAAHEQGILHRDLKPNNLRLTPDGRLKILDFGLAKLLEPAPAESRAATELVTGGVVGTLAYMAPEQLRDEEIDARADLYAAGAVLYEMATGQRPYGARTAPALVDAILHEPPVAPRAVNAAISPELERILLKCLDKAPERRYQSAPELAVDLRRLAGSSELLAPPAVRPRWRRPWWAVAGALMLLAILAVVLAERLLERPGRPGDAAAPGAIGSLAVLPLDNLTEDPEQQYFVDGMHEALIANLAKISALRVISRTSVMRYREATQSLPEIGRELGVDAIVEGSVMRAGDRVRITAQLVHAASDTHLWVESYEGDLRDVLRLQGDTARAIAREIRVVVTPEDRARLEGQRPVDREAYEEYLKGRHYLNQRTEREVLRSLEYFRRSIAIDPSYALAHAVEAEASILTGWYSWVAPRSAFPAAKAAAERALELDPGSAEAHTVAAAVSMLWDWDWVRAEAEFQRAIELDPGYPRAHHWYALFLSYMTRFDESVAEIRRAQTLDPLSVIIHTIAGLAFCQAERHELALREAQDILEISPDFPLAHEVLACAHMGLGRHAEAIAAAQRAVDLTDGSVEIADLAEAYFRAGRRERAEQLVAELEGRAEQGYVAAVPLAAVHLLMGDREAALDWLERAYSQRDWNLVFLQHRRYDELRSDPRFQELYRRVGLPPAGTGPRGGGSIDAGPAAGGGAETGAP